MSSLLPSISERLAEAKDYKYMPQILETLNTCLMIAHEKHEDYANWSSEDLLNIQKKANALSCIDETKLAKRQHLTIMTLIENIFHPKSPFPLPDEMVDRVISCVSDMRDFNAFARLNRHPRWVAASGNALALYARRWAYRKNSSSEAKSYLIHLFDQVRLMCASFQFLQNNFKHKDKWLYPETILKNFPSLPTFEKLKLLSHETFFSPSYSFFRSQIHQEKTIEKSMPDQNLTFFVVRSEEENLLEFLLKTIDYRGIQSHPLHFAAQFGFFKSIKKLIAMDPSAINKQGIYGATPLCFACGFLPLEQSHYSTTIVKYLLDHGTDPRIPTDSSQPGGGQYPLHFAIRRNNIEITELLLKHHVDQTLPDAFGVTPEMLANHLFGRQKIIELLAAYR